MSIDNLFKVSLASKLIDKEVSYHLLRQALRLGLSALELQVLWVVYSSGELVMLDIAAATGYGTQELQPIIEALEAEGLVTEVCFCDSHKRVIAISEKGKNKIRKISDNEGLKFCFTSVLPLKLNGLFFSRCLG